MGIIRGLYLWSSSVDGDGGNVFLTNRGTNGSNRASCGDCCVFRPEPLRDASFGHSDDEAGEREGATVGVMAGSAKESCSLRSLHSSSVEQSSPLLPYSAGTAEDART